ncbi:SPOSA6832_04329, partial [Sporobolomyces salmonicolor]
MAESAPLFPPLHTSDVLACQFSSWYPSFKRAAPKATIIRPIPHEDDFLEYLDSDGLFLPEGSGPNGISELSDSEDEAEEQDEGDSDDDEPPKKEFSFPHLDAEIRQVLARYEGAVFPKLNWSSPQVRLPPSSSSDLPKLQADPFVGGQDAAWMLPGQNLKCQTPADVYLLLKSSDFISHDLDHAFDGCVDFPLPAPSSPSSCPPAPRISQPELSEADLARLTLSSPQGNAAPPSPPRSPTKRQRPYAFELVLKKWFDMPKSQEWRCFVRDRRLVGISQRDTTYYDFLQPEATQRQLTEQIGRFWEENVRDTFPLASCPSPVLPLSDVTTNVTLTLLASRHPPLPLARPRPLLLRTVARHVRRLPHARPLAHVPPRLQPLLALDRPPPLQLRFAPFPRVLLPASPRPQARPIPGDGRDAEVLA